MNRTTIRNPAISFDCIQCVAATTIVSSEPALKKQDRLPSMHTNYADIIQIHIKVYTIDNKIA